MKIINKGFNDLTKNELSELLKSNYISVDTETTGLDALHDKLCTIQIYNKEMGFLFKFNENNSYTNLKELLFFSTIKKIFHNAVFDVGFLMQNFKQDNFHDIICTKISSKIANGLEINNSLKGLVKRYLNVELNKEYQLSNWADQALTSGQIEYAMNDVKYLYDLWLCLQIELEAKDQMNLALKCFEFVPTYIKLSNMGLTNVFRY